MLGSGLNLVTTMIGFGMSATFVDFVCARLICGLAAARALAQQPVPFDFDVEFRNVADLDRTVLIFEGVEVTGYQIFENPKVQKAIEFASTAHLGQFRRTGDPYVTHCIHTGKFDPN